MSGVPPVIKFIYIYTSLSKDAIQYWHSWPSVPRDKKRLRNTVLQWHVAETTLLWHALKSPRSHGRKILQKTFFAGFKGKLRLYTLLDKRAAQENRATVRLSHWRPSLWRPGPWWLRGAQLKSHSGPKKLNLRKGWVNTSILSNIKAKKVQSNMKGDGRAGGRM